MYLFTGYVNSLYSDSITYVHFCKYFLQDFFSSLFVIFRRFLSGLTFTFAAAGPFAAASAFAAAGPFAAAGFSQQQALSQQAPEVFSLLQQKNC